MLNSETLLKHSDPTKTGVFLLQKAVFLVEGKTTGEGKTERCDNNNFTSILVSEGTEYASHAHSVFAKSLVSDMILEIPKVVKYEQAICCTPHFYITYIEMSEWHDSQADPTPSTMWGAKSIFQLFKNMREWSFLVEEPFNSDHPMATYSKLVFDFLTPPQNIVEEIDAMPDMHLAKFLKGRDDYKMIPNPYPEASSEFKEWISQLSINYVKKSFSQILEEL